MQLCHWKIRALVLRNSDSIELSFQPLPTGLRQRFGLLDFASSLYRAFIDLIKLLDSRTMLIRSEYRHPLPPEYSWRNRGGEAPSAVKIESVSPTLSVFALTQPVELYRSLLGFDLAWVSAEPSEIAAICRDGVEITLTQHTDAKPAGAAHVYLGVSDIDEYYGSLPDAGVMIFVPIYTRGYGMRPFASQIRAGMN